MLFHAHAAWWARLTACATACLIVGACAPASERLAAAPAAADINAPAPATAYRPVLHGYTSSRPAGPRPWREQNDRVAPGAKP
jgi:hypothetical protein